MKLSANGTDFDDKPNSYLPFFAYDTEGSICGDEGKAIDIADAMISGALPSEL